MNQEREDYADDSRPLGRLRRWVRANRRRLLIAASLFGLSLAFLITFLCGLVQGSANAKRMHYERRERLIAPVLASDPAFSRVRIHMQIDGAVSLEGEVETRADWEKLRHALQVAIGFQPAWDQMDSVQVRQSGP